MGIPFPVDFPHREALLVKTVHPNHVRGGIVAFSVGGSPLPVMTGSGRLISGQATSMEISAAEVLPFVLCGLALDFRCLSPGQTEVGIPFPVDLPHREALLVKTVHPNHVRGGIVAFSVGGSPLPVMTGSGRLISGQATSMEISAAQVLPFVLCGPALDFRCLSPGQT